MMESPLPGNIGRTGQLRRRRAGVLFAALGAAVTIALVIAGASRWWRMAVFPFLWFGALGFIQAQARTCVAFAARGMCELEDGRSMPLDEATAARMKVRARGVMVKSTVIAAAITLGVVVVG